MDSIQKMQDEGQTVGSDSDSTAISVKTSVLTEWIQNYGGRKLPGRKQLLLSQTTLIASYGKSSSENGLDETDFFTLGIYPSAISKIAVDIDISVKVNLPPPFDINQTRSLSAQVTNENMLIVLGTLPTVGEARQLPSEAMGSPLEILLSDTFNSHGSDLAILFRFE